MSLNQLPKHLAERIEISDEEEFEGTPCWLWTGQLNRNGYGRVYYKGARHMAHREVYRALIGNIGNRQLDHRCYVRNCVNPLHMEKVTNKENSRRRTKRMRCNESV